SEILHASNNPPERRLAGTIACLTKGGLSMRVTSSFVIPLLFSCTLMAQGPWQQISVPPLREAAANFKTPPHEYGTIQPFVSWNGPDAKEIMTRVVRDLDRLENNGVFVFHMSPGRGEPQ